MAKNILKMNRGDTFYFSAQVSNSEDINSLYTLSDTDILYFAIMPPHSRFEDAEIDGGIMQYFLAEDQDQETKLFNIVLKPSDTKDLASGVYYYSIKLQKLSAEDIGNASISSLVGKFELGEVQTIVKRTKFIINE